MKVLHAAALLRPPLGIVNQMRWEHQSAVELNIDWTVKLFCPSGWLEPEDFVEEAPSVRAGNSQKSKPWDWFRFRYSYYKWLLAQVEMYDAFLLRYYVHDPFQLMFVRKCQKPVYFVNHTLEEPELRFSGTTSAKIRSKLENMIGPPTLRAATGIIGVTQEIVEYEVKRAVSKNKPTLIYPNGIKFDSCEVEDRRSSIPEILFVAGRFAPWHGLDLLLDSIEKSDSEFKLHLVGKIEEPNYSRIQGDSRIVAHGRKSQDQIREIAKSCWIGLSSFGMHRQNMTEACTLKVREYLMMGLPVYAGHRDVIQNENRFFISGNPDIEIILKVAKIEKPTRKEVADNSKPSICKKMLLNELYKKLKEKA